MPSPEGWAEVNMLSMPPGKTSRSVASMIVSAGPEIVAQRHDRPSRMAMRRQRVGGGLQSCRRRMMVSNGNQSDPPFASEDRLCSITAASAFANPIVGFGSGRRNVPAVALRGFERDQRLSLAQRRPRVGSTTGPEFDQRTLSASQPAVRRTKDDIGIVLFDRAGSQ